MLLDKCFLACVTTLCNFTRTSPEVTLYSTFRGFSFHGNVIGICGKRNIVAIGHEIVRDKRSSFFSGNVKDHYSDSGKIDICTRSLENRNSPVLTKIEVIF